MGQFLTPIRFLLLTGWQSIIANRNALTWKGFAATAFLSYFTIIVRYGFWIYLLTRYPTAKISPLSLWVPDINMIFAYLFLDEQLNTLQ